MAYSYWKPTCQSIIEFFDVLYSSSKGFSPLAGKVVQCGNLDTVPLAYINKCKNLACLKSSIIIFSFDHIVSVFGIFCDLFYGQAVCPLPCVYIGLIAQYSNHLTIPFLILPTHRSFIYFAVQCNFTAYLPVLVAVSESDVNKQSYQSLCIIQLSKVKWK